MPRVKKVAKLTDEKRRGHRRHTIHVKHNCPEIGFTFFFQFLFVNGQPKPNIFGCLQDNTRIYALSLTVSLSSMPTTIRTCRSLIFSSDLLDNLFRFRPEREILIYYLQGSTHSYAQYFTL